MFETLDNKGPYEEFLAYQTHSPKSLSFIIEDRHRFDA